MTTQPRDAVTWRTSSPAQPRDHTFALAAKRVPHTVLSHTEEGLWLHDLSANTTARSR